MGYMVTGYVWVMGSGLWFMIMVYGLWLMCYV